MADAVKEFVNTETDADGAGHDFAVHWQGHNHHQGGISMSVRNEAERVPEIFLHLAEEGQVSALRDRTGVYEFDITEGGGTWFVSLDHGTPSLAESAEHPSVVIQCSPKDFVAMTDGSQNLVTAFLQGRVICTGDLALALDFRRLVPVPG